MSNTLAELQQECERIGRRLTDAKLPLKMYGKNCQVKLELCGDNGNYWVEVRSSIDLDEKVAIIMQMFEDGTNGSIAMAVANQIKQGVIDKACEWLKENIYHRVYECGDRLGFPTADFIKDFRKSMEK